VATASKNATPIALLSSNPIRFAADLLAFSAVAHTASCLTPRLCI